MELKETGWNGMDWIHLSRIGTRGLFFWKRFINIGSISLLLRTQLLLKKNMLHGVDYFSEGVFSYKISSLRLVNGLSVVLFRSQKLHNHRCWWFPNSVNHVCKLTFLAVCKTQPKDILT
jgi:hypothetical protein